jgi:hypothetical protein
MRSWLFLAYSAFLCSFDLDPRAVFGSPVLWYDLPSG